MDKLEPIHKRLTARRRIRVKLIFNPEAGTASESPVDLMDVISEMQKWNLVPETFLITPDCDLPGVIQSALSQGIHMFVACGGDGTISSVARLLVGTRATLGIIPLGTQNNTALSLSIPTDIPAAIVILRTGIRIKVDVGLAICGKINIPFLEVCSVGLVSTLFPSADDVQHGNLAKVGEFLTTLAESPPAEIHLFLENKKKIMSLGHVVLVSNMPYIGLHYQVGDPTSYSDGLLDVLFFADLSKLELLGYVFQGIGEGKPEDPRIQHYQVRKVIVDTKPSMPVMVDGVDIGEGKVSIQVKHRALSVMVLSKEKDLSSRLEKGIQ
jgi:diacylglycerol kinase family enzyme